MTKATPYKNTAIGPIPTDWEVKEFFSFTNLSKEKYTPNVNEDYRCLELEHFEQETGTINGWVNSSNQKSTKNKFRNGDVLFGKLRPYLRKYWLAEFDGVCSSEVWVLNSNQQFCSNEFLFRLIQSDSFISVSNISSGSKMPRADWSYVSQFPFPLPPLPEQLKIAEILSTWDKAIQETDAIIKKLEVRNKALAFSLLTGKKRVKGFEDKEFKKSLANEVFKSVSIKNNPEDSVLLSATQEFGMIPRDMIETRVTMPSGSLKTYKLVEKGDFVISLRSFQGGIEYSEYTGLVSPAYTVLKSINSINEDFYKYYFKSEDLIGRLSVAVIGIRDGKNISYDDFSTIVLPNPSLEEQNAIAAILNTANQELKQYQEKLTQLKQQKKGLMQQLLTGKVRTV